MAPNTRWVCYCVIYACCRWTIRPRGGSCMQLGYPSCGAPNTSTTHPNVPKRRKRPCRSRPPSRPRPAHGHGYLGCPAAGRPPHWARCVDLCWPSHQPTIRPDSTARFGGRSPPVSTGHGAIRTPHRAPTAPTTRGPSMGTRRAQPRTPPPATALSVRPVALGGNFRKFFWKSDPSRRFRLREISMEIRPS